MLSTPPPAATPRRAARFERVPAPAVDLARNAGVGAARHLDRTGKRSGSVGDASAAAHDANFAEIGRIVRRPVHPAAERIGLRHSVEHQQGAARGVAAERAQGDALARRMTAARVRSAEQLDARDILQQLVDFMARRLLDLPPADPLDGIDALSLRFGQRLAGDHDRR